MLSSGHRDVRRLPLSGREEGDSGGLGLGLVRGLLGVLYQSSLTRWFFTDVQRLSLSLMSLEPVCTEVLTTQVRGCS